jgi:hypothetical protein
MIQSLLPPQYCGGSNDCIIIVYVKDKNMQLSNIVGEVMIN